MKYKKYYKRFYKRYYIIKKGIEIISINIGDTKYKTKILPKGYWIGKKKRSNSKAIQVLGIENSRQKALKWLIKYIKKDIEENGDYSYSISHELD